MSFKETVRAKAAEWARKQAEEAANPELATKRAMQRREEERIAREEGRRLHEQEQIDAMPTHLKACGLEPREIEWLKSGLDGSWEAVRNAREWWQGEAGLLLLYGTTGVGKTLAAADIISRCRFRFHRSDLGDVWEWPRALQESALYVTSGQLATLSYYGEDSEKTRRRLQECRLLVIDELGSEVMSSAWLSLLETIVDQRHRNPRKTRTLLLANLTGQAFKERYGDRIARRVREDGGAVKLGDKTLSGGGA